MTKRRVVYVRVSNVNFFPLVPGEPTSVRVSAVNSTTIHVSWKPPAEKDRNGIIRGYHIHIHEVKDEVNEKEKIEKVKKI